VAGRCQAHPAVPVTQRLAVDHLVEVRIPGGQRQAHLAAVPVAVDIAALLRAAGTAEATPEADRAEAHLVADTRPPETTVTTNRFAPRFIPLLTHRREAPKGASCLPQRRWVKKWK
jgi:hypothetical protein